MKVSVALCSGKAILLFLEGSMFSEGVKSHTKPLTLHFQEMGFVRSPEIVIITPDIYIRILVPCEAGV